MNDWLIPALVVAAAAVLLLVAAFGASWLAQRRAGARLDVLQGLLTRLVEAHAAHAARLEALAASLQEERALAPPPAAARAYELAAHLASSGVGSEQLVAQCGLTPAEAELAVRIHGLRARTRAA